MGDRLLALLAPQRVRRASAIVFVVCAAIQVMLLSRASGVRLPSGDIAFGDLQCLLTSGKILLEGNLSRLYDPIEQARVQAAMVSPEAPLDLYLSPPFMAVVWTPLAALPYFAAGIVWNLCTVALGALAAKLTERALGVPWIATALLLGASEPFWQTMASGQDSLIALVLYAAALLALRRDDDLLAGALIGLGSFKPQLFWLAPIALFAARRPRAVLSFAVTVAALAGASVAMIGWDGTKQYVALLQSPLYHQQIDLHLAKTAGVLVFSRALLPAPAAAAAGIAAALAIVLFTVKHVRAHPAHALGLAAIGSMLGAPHGFVYDAVILMVPLAQLHVIDRRAGSIAALTTLAITWLVPMTRDLSTAPMPARLVALPWTTAALAIAFVLWLRARPAAR